MSQSGRKAARPAVPRRHRVRWTADERILVEKHYCGMTARSIAEMLGRSVNGVRQMINQLGLKEQLCTPWTEDEIALLRAHYEKGKGIEQVMRLLPHRTKGAITTCACKQGITGREYWNAWEKSFLKKHYRTMTASQIAATLGRSVSGVRGAVNALRLSTKQPGMWRDEEIALLRAHYHDGVAGMPSLLPGRSKGAIMVQAGKMGLTRPRSWSPEEELILRTYYPTIGTTVADKLPHRTPAAIKGRVQLLGLKRRRPARSAEMAHGNGDSKTAKPTGRK